MRFWDSSAIVPLVIWERSSALLRDQMATDSAQLVWWSTELECLSALSWRERERTLSADQVAAALTDLNTLRNRWTEIQPADRVRQRAYRLLRVHSLSAADALQLAAAVAAAEDHATSLPFVTLDDRLADAADREGFPVIRPIA